MHQISLLDKTDCQAITTLFGRRADKSIERLEQASMISTKDGFISSMPLTSLYAVRHIFAIEVKINSWRQALRQAVLNRWFASSSHVLLPRMPSNAKIIDEARFLGVGLWGFDVGKFTLNLPTKPSGPVSYASWLFNEWSWKVWSNSSRSNEQSKHTPLDSELVS
jgi:hypothetical protein